MISETYFLKAFCSSGFRIQNRSFFFAPFLIVAGVQLEADAENEDVADYVADDDDDEDWDVLFFFKAFTGFLAALTMFKTSLIVIK